MPPRWNAESHRAPLPHELFIAIENVIGMLRARKKHCLAVSAALAGAPAKFARAQIEEVIGAATKRAMSRQGALAGKIGS